MYVISLVRLKKNLWLFLKILAILILVGLVLPRVLGFVSDWVSPRSVGASGKSLASSFSQVLSGIADRLNPYVETLKDYYRGK